MLFRGAFITTTALLFSTTVTTIIGTAMALSTTTKTSSDRLPTMRNIDCTISHLSSSSTTELSSKAVDERIKCMAELTTDIDFGNFKVIDDYEIDKKRLKRIHNAAEDHPTTA